MPIRGKKVVITRALDQSDEFIQQIKNLGGTPILFPLIEIKKTTFNKEQLILSKPDWLIFTSINAVQYFFAEKISWDQPPKIAVIGPKVKEQVEQIGYTVQYMPIAYTSEHLVADFPEKKVNVAYLKGNLASDQIKDRLFKKHQIKVTEWVIYQTNEILKTKQELQEIKQSDYITFTSPSTVNAFNISCTKHNISYINKSIICIGPVTASMAIEKGFKNVIFPKEHTVAGMVELMDNSSEMKNK